MGANCDKVIHINSWVQVSNVDSNKVTECSLGLQADEGRIHRLNWSHISMHLWAGTFSGMVLKLSIEDFHEVGLCSWPEMPIHDAPCSEADLLSFVGILLE